jgi:hypothetical protein
MGLPIPEYCLLCREVLGGWMEYGDSEDTTSGRDQCHFAQVRIESRE